MPVAEVLADRFRQDLLDGGMGNGRHGFEVALDLASLSTPTPSMSAGDRNAGPIRSAPSSRAANDSSDARHDASARAENEPSDTRHVELVRASDGAKLQASPFTLDLSDAARLRIDVLEERGVGGEIRAAKGKCLPGDIVSVHADGAFVASGPCESTNEPDRFRFQMYLPPHLFDGRAHVFEAMLAARDSVCELAADILPILPTPWSEIIDSSRERGYAGLSRLASLRYEALRAQLRLAAERGASADTLANLTLAHDVVVEGYTDRRRFPPLALPHFEHAFRRESAGGAEEITSDEMGGSAVDDIGELPRRTNRERAGTGTGRSTTHHAPAVSVIVPVHDQLALTYHCLASLVLAADRTPFEVILVDDASNDGTREIESIVANLRVIRNEENAGFLHSCNRAAAEARGTHLVFLNNDTEVTSGWIEALLEVFERFTDVGASGARLIYPDGRLQDAGGLVWESGTPWNVGHGENAWAPEFSYAREVDYLTGAALMVDRDAWERVGGFSEAYAPAYYEDTDLAFKLRDAGYRTVYCPHATVVHFEGQSNGTSPEHGIKRYQTLNARRFVNTWRHAFAGNGEEGVEPALQRDRGRDFRMLMIDHAFPCEGQDAGSHAAVREIRLMIELGCKITFVPHNFEHRGRHVETLQKLGVECIHAPFHTSVPVFLEQRGREFDAVYITRYDIAERVLPAIRRHTTAKVLFNNADLHFLRELRGALARGERDMSGPESTRRRELAVMDEVDAVLSYNETERTIIASHLLRNEHVFPCPWVLEHKGSGRPFAEREGLAFLGGFGHPPNREAVEYFVSAVMPLLATRRPGLRLHVWGSRLPESLAETLRAVAGDAVIVEGFAESLDQVFDTCRVFVAPLLSGAGIKGKVLDSIAYGVPTVLSPIAVEATGLVDGVSTLVADTPERWVEQILRAHDDESTWSALSREAERLIDARYSFDHGLERMRDVFEHVGLAQSARTRPRLLK